MFRDYLYGTNFFIKSKKKLMLQLSGMNCETVSPEKAYAEISVWDTKVEVLKALENQYKLSYWRACLIGATRQYFK
jgi:hypothetical protein